jgi:Iron-containing redox enzyme
VVATYFDEHIEADVVHEQLAFREICGTIAAERPELLSDVFFGAAAYLFSEALAGGAMLDAWRAGRSSLLDDDTLESLDDLETAVAS